MRLPYSVEFGYINYLLSTISRLTENQPDCDVGILVDTCKSQVFDGRINIGYHDILNLCQHAKLIVLKTGRTSLTPLGIEFLRLNPSSQYEFTSGQKEFFATNMLFSGPWKAQMKSHFKPFLANSKEHTFAFYLDDGHTIPPEFRAHLQILFSLGILESKDNHYQVTAKYVKYIVAFRNEDNVLSQEELEERLIRNRDQGAKAEELIVEYEKARLSSLGRIAEADRVKVISQPETDAGYDIRSFDGDKPTMEYDRFIEVKSSENRDLSFHWSINEMTTAERLGDQYWIYYVGSFHIDQKLDDIEPVLIQDPFKKIQAHNNIEFKPNNYRVYQKTEITYHDLEYFKGKYL